MQISYLPVLLILCRSCDSSVGITTGYGLDDRGSRVQLFSSPPRSDHLVPRLRMRGAIPPLPQYVFMAWCLVKHRDNFTLPLSLLKLGPVPVARGLWAGIVSDGWNSGIVGSNPARGTDVLVCPRFSVLCCPV
jgi:hypothetical protein